MIADPQRFYRLLRDINKEIELLRAEGYKVMSKSDEHDDLESGSSLFLALFYEIRP